MLLLFALEDDVPLVGCVQLEAGVDPFEPTPDPVPFDDEAATAAAAAAAAAAADVPPVPEIHDCSVTADILIAAV